MANICQMTNHNVYPVDNIVLVAAQLCVILAILDIQQLIQIQRIVSLLKQDKALHIKQAINIHQGH